ncbi:MAG: hypothetical protein KAU44_00680, partial [Candidatus Marinimicrobia bacterium]|nr:hypothetical protein [Candidatus Neomarinimicrobiota bacterium]
MTYIINPFTPPVGGLNNPEARLKQVQPDVVQDFQDDPRVSFTPVVTTALFCFLIIVIVNSFHHRLLSFVNCQLSTILCPLSFV